MMVTSNQPYINRYAKDYPGEMGAKFALFFIWPFGSWLYSLKSANTKSSMVVFFLFSLLVCWHFSPTGYTDYYDDFIEILERFNESTFSTSAILDEIKAFFTFSDNAPKELYEHIVIWLTKSFTNNYHAYFLLAAIPVALCMTKYIKFYVTDSRFIPNIIGLLVLFMAILPRDIFTVQNYRYATGFWICAICTIRYYCCGRKWKYIISIILSPAIHSAMWVYVGLFTLGLFIPQKIKLLQIIAICSIPFAFFDPNLLENFNFSILPYSVQVWAEYYMGDQMFAEYILHEGRSGFWWVDAMFNIAMRFMYIYMTLSMIRNRTILEKSLDARNFYPFYLILFSFVNMIQFIPVLCDRFFWFTRVFCLFVWFKAFFSITSHRKELYLLVCACSWSIFKRYGYVLGGALSVNTPIDLFYAPLPYLIGKGLFW